MGDNEVEGKGAVAPRPASGSPSSDSSSVSREPATDSLADTKARQSILKQIATKSVTRLVEESRCGEAKRDPVFAKQILKRSIQAIEAADLESDTKAKLRSRLESQLRILFREQQRMEADLADRSRALAQSHSRSVHQTADMTRQQQDKQLLDEFRVLLSQGEYASSTRVAEEVIKNSPDSVAALASNLKGMYADRYAMNEEVEFARQDGWWKTLQSTEFSGVPQPDNRPTVFPGPKSGRS